MDGVHKKQKQKFDGFFFFFGGGGVGDHFLDQSFVWDMQNSGDTGLWR